MHTGPSLIATWSALVLYCIIIETVMGEYTNILHSMKLYKLGPEYIPGNTYLGLM